MICTSSGLSLRPRYQSHRAIAHAIRSVPRATIALSTTRTKIESRGRAAVLTAGNIERGNVDRHKHDDIPRVRARPFTDVLSVAAARPVSKFAGAEFMFAVVEHRPIGHSLTIRAGRVEGY